MKFLRKVNMYIFRLVALPTYRVVEASSLYDKPVKKKKKRNTKETTLRTPTSYTNFIQEYCISRRISVNIRYLYTVTVDTNRGTI